MPEGANLTSDIYELPGKIHAVCDRLARNLDSEPSFQRENYNQLQRLRGSAEELIRLFNDFSVPEPAGQHRNIGGQSADRLNVPAGATSPFNQAQPVLGLEAEYHKNRDRIDHASGPSLGLSADIEAERNRDADPAKPGEILFPRNVHYAVSIVETRQCKYSWIPLRMIPQAYRNSSWSPKEISDTLIIREGWTLKLRAIGGICDVKIKPFGFLSYINMTFRVYDDQICPDVILGRDNADTIDSQRLFHPRRPISGAFSAVSTTQSSVTPNAVDNSPRSALSHERRENHRSASHTSKPSIPAQPSISRKANVQTNMSPNATGLIEARVQASAADRGFPKTHQGVGKNWPDPDPAKTDRTSKFTANPHLMNGSDAAAGFGCSVGGAESGEGSIPYSKQKGGWHLLMSFLSQPIMLTAFFLILVLHALFLFGLNSVHTTKIKTAIQSTTSYLGEIVTSNSAGYCSLILLAILSGRLFWIWRMSNLISR